MTGEEHRVVAFERVRPAIASMRIQKRTKMAKHNMSVQPRSFLSSKAWSCQECKGGASVRIRIWRVQGRSLGVQSCAQPPASGTTISAMLRPCET